MPLPDDQSRGSQQYSVVASTITYANSPSDALDMFLTQMSTGDVVIEIHNSDEDDAHDIDPLGDENAASQLAMAITLLARHVSQLSNHEKLHVKSQIDTVLGYATGPRAS